MPDRTRELAQRRRNHNQRRRGALAGAAVAAAALIGAVTPLVTPRAATAVTQPAATHASVALPARGAFSYPWYPEAWSQSGFDPATHYRPTPGYYSSTAVMAEHVKALLYGHFAFDVSSWWGRASKEDARFGPLLAAAHGTALKVAPYYEAEGNATSTTPGSPNPSAAQITADLDYLAAHYTADPSYLWIAGKPAVFVYGDGSDGCDMAARWARGNAAATERFYVVLKVFSGYGSCASQPDNWHQYGPAVAESAQGAHSFTISPGFWKFGESTPRLARSTSRWATDVTDMNCSSAALRLVTTFNEWGEGTAVESATAWATASGYGRYLDVLHNRPGCPTAGTSP